MRKRLATVVSFVLIAFALGSVQPRTASEAQVSPKPAQAPEVGVEISDGDTDTYDLAPVVTPDPVDGRELDHVVKMRSLWGVSADPDYVRALHLEPDAYQAVRSTRLQLGNLMFSPAELPALKVHAELEWLRQDAENWAKGKMPASSFAGGFLDASSLVLLCAHCDAQQLQLAAAQDPELPTALRQGIRVRAVSRSLDELNTLQGALIEYLSSVGARPGGTATVVATNQVRLTLGPVPEPKNLEALVADRFGSAVKIVSGAGEITPTVDKNDWLIYNLVVGGQALKKNGDPTYSCTSAFAVSTTAYGPFMMTADHCADIGQVWNQGGATLGVETSNHGGSFDISLITTNGYRNNHGRFHHTSSDPVAPITFAASNGDIMGATVCQAGATTTGISGDLHPNSRCGEIWTMTAQGAAPYWQDPYYIGIDYLGDYGDSGATVVWPTIYGWGGIGIQSAVMPPIPNYDSYASRLADFLWFNNVQLTPCAC